MYNIPNFKASPQPVSILKQSSFYDEEVSPFNLTLGLRQVSLPPNTTLDTTFHNTTLQNTEPSFIKDSFISHQSKPGAAYKAIITAIPDGADYGRKRAASTVQQFPEIGRRRATSTVMKLNSSSLQEKAVTLESADEGQGLGLPPKIPQIGRGRATTMATSGKLNRSFKEKSNILDTSYGNLNNTSNVSDLSFSSVIKTQNSGRAKSKTITSVTLTPFHSSPRARQVSIDKRAKNTDPSPTPSIDGRIRLQSLPSNKIALTESTIVPKRKFRADNSKAAKENQILVSLIGSADPLKKKRFVKFFDSWLKRVYNYTEEKKKPTIIEERKFPGRSIDSHFQKQVDKSDKDSESMDEVRELYSETKEGARRGLAEFVFYKEINDLIQFCVNENSIPLFLKALKLLGCLYLHFEKLDEAFHCFGQLRWASEYLAEYKFKTKAYYKMAECCKLVENYDEAIKLLRKALQYSWEYNLVNSEMKIYDFLGKIYYLKGEVKKAFYYSERFASGHSEPKDSPLREAYNIFLKDSKERGKYGNFFSLDTAFLQRISIPSLPINEGTRRSSIVSSLTSITLSLGDQKKQKFDRIHRRPDNVKAYQDQLNIMMADSEILVQKGPQNENNNADIAEEPEEKQSAEPTELPSPTYKTNFADFDPGKTHEQKIRDIKIKEERIYSVIRNAKKELRAMEDEEDRKRRMDNLVQLQTAFRREKRLILRHQQDYRIHLAQLYKTQYHVFESKSKAATAKVNIKTDSNIVMENKLDMKLEDPDYFQSVKTKVMALRFENNLPPFVLMTHKKMPEKPLKRDNMLLNEGAKKILLKFYKKFIKKIEPEKSKKLIDRKETLNTNNTDKDKGNISLQLIP